MLLALVIELTPQGTGSSCGGLKSVAQSPKSVATFPGIRSCCRCPPAALCIRLDLATTFAK
jgi:hypothetical protein